MDCFSEHHYFRFIPKTTFLLEDFESSKFLSLIGGDTNWFFPIGYSKSSMWKVVSAESPISIDHVKWFMSNLNSGRHIAMVNVQCSIMIPFIRFTKLQNRPTGMDFDLKVVPKNIPSFRYFWLKILDVYFTGLLRQKAEIELGVGQELDMGYCDEAERVLDTGTVTLLEKVLDTGNFSLIRAEARQ